MAFKEIYFKEIGRSNLLAGVNKGADVAAVTIGPSGRNVMVDRGILLPLITNDGYKAIQALVLKDRVENMGLDVLKDIVRRTGETARGARTASALFTRAMLREGLALLTPEVNVIKLQKEIIKVANKVIDELKKVTIPVTSIEDIKNVSIISSESKIVGEIIANIIQEIGKDGTITSEEDPTKIGITYESAQGMKINQGWIDSYFVTDYDKMIAEYSDVAVILVDKKLLMADEVKDLIGSLGEKGVGEILLIAEDIQGEVLRMCIENKLRGGFKIVAVKTPGSFGSNKKEILKDIAALTGATILGDAINLKTAKIDSVGFSSKIIVGENSSIILGNPERQKEVADRITSLKEQKKGLKSKIDIDNIEDRIARLSGGAAIITVGTATNVGINYTKDKIDDAIAESRAAYEEGIIPGGGSALAKIGYFMEIPKALSKEESIAYQIVTTATIEPLFQIMANSGRNEAERKSDFGMITTAAVAHPNNGYDASRDIVIDDMVEAGIIDAFKVVKTAFYNAAEGVGTLLTIEAVEFDENIINKKE